MGNSEFCIIICNCDTIENSELIASTLINESLAACVSIIPKITSYYMWEGKLTKESEFTLLIKSQNSNFEAIKNKIISLHTYSIPEIISVEISNGNKEYFDWMRNSLSL